MAKTINLTKVDGCYSKELLESQSVLKEMFFNATVSVYTMRKTVLEIISPAFIEADAKRRFTTNLTQCRTKAAIYKLCTNAITHGMYYHPKSVSA